MSLRYKPYKRFHLHNDTVAAIAFSPDATLIASGGLDGRLGIWSSKTGKLIHLVNGSSGVISLTWSSQKQIRCGLRSGVVVTVEIRSVCNVTSPRILIFLFSMLVKADICATGFQAHSHPVECMAFEKNILVTGAYNELRVWNLVNDSRFAG